MSKLSTTEIMITAWKARKIVPAFNIPHLPMMAPVVQALRDTKTFGLIQVARLEWKKFQSKSLKAIRDEYEKTKDECYTRLHLDHVPVIDEDDLKVDFEAIISEAISLGYKSVMVDGSRLSLEDNIAATSKAVKLARAAGVPIEAELGAVLGHEAGPLPPYDELFESGKGFTDPAEAKRFVDETGVDWLSVSIGNIHGAISGAAKSQKKVAARLQIEQIDKLENSTQIPLVLHGGSGIQKACLLEAFAHGITKINIGTTIRQTYEAGAFESVETGQKNVYDSTVELVTNELEVAGSASIINPQDS
jgi:ketose-bisphosphate aldolase